MARVRNRIAGARDAFRNLGSAALLTLASVISCLPSAMAQEVWREPATGMEFVRVPAGCFDMGDTFGDGETNELPVHKVCMSAYWIGRHEVTQAQWTSLMDYNLSVFATSPQHPVDSVNQIDIETFVRKLGEHHPGKVFRLPTEAEWEYACRAAGKAEKFGGEAPPEGANTAEYADEHGEGSVAVGAFAPNALGLHDMSGNLWEWVSDVYAADAYEQHAAENPHYQAAGPARMLRGGGWSHPGAFARCSKRHMHCRPSARFDFVGFRLVLEEQGAAASD
ncbi:formylglycine-generating enzyme family protein [Thauera sp. WH-2]|jgi:formylglycine-generating enzyme required for sulfatase activity|uniref:formylglycine-generating enzyme family protein n=1 Tax=unclassified Thauera TaxID=2609274 RepID=UPI003AAE0EC7